MQQHKHNIHAIDKLNQTILRIDTEAIKIANDIAVHKHEHQDGHDDIIDQIDTLEIHCNKRIADHAALIEDLLRRIEHIQAHSGC